MKPWSIAFAVFGSAILAAAQTPVAAANPLARQYREGEILTYRMAGVNENWRYRIQADGIVKKSPAGVWGEEYRWSKMISDGQPVVLAPSTAGFRQQLSLDPRRTPGAPDLSKVDSRIIGPITDFMTFYVDLWLANKVGQLHRAGDHFYVPNGTPQSWADGTHVILGESAVDFDLTLKSIDAAQNTAVLLVRHVPPSRGSVKLPAEWMRTPVTDMPNNWVGVTKTGDGKYDAAVGRETLDVEMTVSTQDGKILSGTLDNIVQTSRRTCDDAALTQCSEPQPRTIHRHVKIALQP